MRLTISEEESERIFDDMHDFYDLVFDEGWKDEGKYSHGTKIMMDKEGLYWQINASRTGSYFTDYEYSYDTELIQVREITRTVTVWMEIKDASNQIKEPIPSPQ